MKETEIRPQALLERYLELSSQDASICFDGAPRSYLPCVACGETQTDYQFTKLGFAYTSCTACGTLFQNPRPPIAAFEAFYRDSASSRYWADVFFPAVAETRREKIFRPRARALAQVCTRRGTTVDFVIDVGAGYGVFLEEWRRLSPNVRALAVEPSPSLAHACRARGLEVVEEMVESVSGHDEVADMVTCFEVLEHVYDPLRFVRALKRLVRPGGLVSLSTLGIDGFDLQVLWDKATQISPPHHINFLSVRGFNLLFERAGLIEVEVTTPGELDVDIVRNAVAKDPAVLQGQRVVSRFLADDDVASAFQRFLVDQRLSSHVWVTGRKPDRIATGT